MKLKEIMIIMTEKCNLSCKYCYVSKNSDHKENISIGVLKEIINWIESILSKGLPVRIDLFGGEPLIVFEEVKYFLGNLYPLYKKYGPNISVTLFTNATLLSLDRLLYLSQFEYLDYNFSVDGNKACHNIDRSYIDDSDSYDDIYNNLQDYRAVYDIPSYQPIKTMYTLSPNNIKLHLDTIRHFMNTGVKEFYSNFVRDDIWSAEDIDKYNIIMNNSVDFYLDNYERFGLINMLFIYYINDMYIKRTAFCGAGDEIIGIAPNGDIYPCPRFYNSRTSYKIGTVFDGIDELSGKFQALKKINMRNINKCLNCPYELYPGCSGQCLCSCLESNGTIFKPIDSVCLLHKINFDASIRLYEGLKGNENFQKQLASVINRRVT